MAKIDRNFIPITPDRLVRRIEDVEVKRTYNHDDDYEEILSLKFIDEKIDELTRKRRELQDKITEYRRLRALVLSEASSVILRL
ncbi:MAG: hypothetical protein ACFFDY_00535 [Candidatus Thorarchaeota archaeon]